MKEVTARVYSSQSISGTLSEVFVHPGEWMCVWLHGKHVELRVLENGTCEIYTNLEDDIQLKQFSEWFDADIRLEEQK